MKVILEGCNGDWAQKRYLPALVERAAKGDIELLAVDIVPHIQLMDRKVAVSWQTAQEWGKAHYLSKLDVKDKVDYAGVRNVDYVFIVAPDHYHCEIAEFWLERLTAEGRIFIEKPLDASLRSALKLKSKVGKRDAICAFDHYLARASPFLEKRAEYLRRIGKIARIEFHILEPFGIPANRVKALDKGMIFDLFCHCLALVSAVFDSTSALSNTILQTGKIEGVKAGQYTKCPISGESFAWIKFLINEVEVESVVGKCVGTREDKCMMISGLKEQIKLDLLEDKLYTFDSQKIQQTELESKHVESFLDSVLSQETQPFLAPGVINFDTALEILRILDEAKMRIENIPRYRAGQSISSILRNLPLT